MNTVQQLIISGDVCSYIPAPPEGTQKPSSLKSKVRERQERLERRERLLSVLTAPEVSIQFCQHYMSGDHYMKN